MGRKSLEPTCATGEETTQHRLPLLKIPLHIYGINRTNILDFMSQEKSTTLKTLINMGNEHSMNH